MTTVGKILVVLHLVLSVIFMAFAGAVFTAQKNWRTAAEASDKALKTTKTKLTDQQAADLRARIEAGVPIARAAREAGISRTSAYTYIKAGIAAQPAVA